jgi:hypothetical protein
MLLAVVRPEHLHVGGRKSSVTKTLRHRVRGRRRVAHRVGRIDLDELFEDLAAQPHRRVIERRHRGKPREEKQS